MTAAEQRSFVPLCSCQTEVIHPIMQLPNRFLLQLDRAAELNRVHLMHHAAAEAWLEEPFPSRLGRLPLLLL